jgi:hypothetical protein
VNKQTDKDTRDKNKKGLAMTKMPACTQGGHIGGLTNFLQLEATTKAWERGEAVVIDGFTMAPIFLGGWRQEGEVRGKRREEGKRRGRE